MKYILIAGLLIEVMACAVIVTARAQSGGGASTALSTGYDLIWNTIDNGGGNDCATGINPPNFSVLPKFTVSGYN